MCYPHCTNPGRGLSILTCHGFEKVLCFFFFFLSAHSLAPGIQAEVPGGADGPASAQKRGFAILLSQKQKLHLSSESRLCFTKFAVFFFFDSVTSSSPGDLCVTKDGGEIISNFTLRSILTHTAHLQSHVLLLRGESCCLPCKWIHLGAQRLAWNEAEIQSPRQQGFILRPRCNRGSLNFCPHESKNTEQIQLPDSRIWIDAILFFFIFCPANMPCCSLFI